MWLQQRSKHPFEPISVKNEHVFIISAAETWSEVKDEENQRKVCRSGPRIHLVSEVILMYQC